MVGGRYLHKCHLFGPARFLPLFSPLDFMEQSVNISSEVFCGSGLRVILTVTWWGSMVVVSQCLLFLVFSLPN